MHKIFFIILILFNAVTTAIDADPGIENLEHVIQKLVSPPFLPKHEQIVGSESRVIQIRMVVEEKEMQVENGLKAHVMAFNGSIPGPIVIAHENDYVELTLVNPITNTMIHNIDFHAATGALGGGTLTKVAPGQEVVLRFKTIKPGVFIYHCAPGGLMIPFHVAMGMSGAIMVLPRDGLSDEQGNPVHYDRAYYIGEQGFYFPKDAEGRSEHYSNTLEALPFILGKMRTLTPSHVVFNGAVDSLTDDHALTAQTGEKVLFIHSQGNEDSRPTLTGEKAKLVWTGGSFSDQPITDQETWFVPGGTAVAALYEFNQSGTFNYFNKNIPPDTQSGPLAHIKIK